MKIIFKHFKIRQVETNLYSEQIIINTNLKIAGQEEEDRKIYHDSEEPEVQS